MFLNLDYIFLILNSNLSLYKYQSSCYFVQKMDKLFLFTITNHFGNRNSKNTFPTDTPFVKKKLKERNLFCKPKGPLQKTLAKYSPKT